MANADGSMSISDRSQAHCHAQIQDQGQDTGPAQESGPEQAPASASTPTNGTSPTLSASTPSHPLTPLTKDEITQATRILRAQIPLRRPEITSSSIRIRSISLREPAKAPLLAYLAAEHSGLPHASRPTVPRLADAVFGVSSPYVSCESVLDLDRGLEVSFTEAGPGEHGILDLEEMNRAIAVLKGSAEWREALAEVGLPQGAEADLEYEAWPYGADRESDENTHRLTRIYPYGKPECGHPDGNVFARPVPLAAVFDLFEDKVLKIERLPTDGVRAPAPGEGVELLRFGAGDGDRANGTNGTNGASSKPSIEPSKEFTPELNTTPLRPIPKPIHITQPDGVDWRVHEDGWLVSWQNWRFRAGFNAREGLTLHDVRFSNRSLFHRLSVSEMTVPYGDPRPPFHLKQAFDLGDIGAGSSATTLSANCDCLGVIHYFDAWGVDWDGDGTPLHAPRVVCMHEQDDGVLWRHFNALSGSTVLVRNRVLVLQTTITLGNYDYVVGWHFDQAAGLEFELRATGIVATQRIDDGCVSPWGTVVSPGVMAPNHQHFTCVRIDPAIGGGDKGNTVVMQETVPAGDDIVDDDEDSSSSSTTGTTGTTGITTSTTTASSSSPTPKHDLTHGNGWTTRSVPILTSSSHDASPLTNRIFALLNEKLINPISHRPVGYKLTPIPSALLLARPWSVQARRARFASHHVWVTRHRDGALYAAGRWTSQSTEERGGVADEADRREDTRDADVVVWHSFGMSHKPRVEDWPVMPVERLAFTLKPVDFFAANPALDVPALSSGAAFRGEKGNGGS